MPAPLQTLRWHLGGRWVCQDGITWWPVGVEGKNSLIPPGAQIYSKLEEDGHSPGGGRAWPKPPHPPLTSPGSTLKSVCSTTPKSGAGSSLGRVRRVRVWPPPRDSANLGDRQGGHWRLWISSASVLCGVGWGFADWVEILALPPHGAQGRISVFRPVRCLPYRVIAAEIKWE